MGCRQAAGKERMYQQAKACLLYTSVVVADPEGDARADEAVRFRGDVGIQGRLLTSVAAFDFAADQPEGNGDVYKRKG